MANRAQQGFFQLRGFGGALVCASLVLLGLVYMGGSDSVTAFLRGGQRKDVRTHRNVLGAFSLYIQVKFSGLEARRRFIEIYKEEADFVRTSEPNTLAYELALSDKDPLKAMLIERFVAREDYVRHRETPVFLRFREALQEMQAKGDVALEGGSYLDTNIGFA